MAVTKIISGGQTGADQGGLIAGKLLGLETGGTAAPGFMTHDGPNMKLHSAFGLVEGEPDAKVYPKRTIKNVIDSDATLWIGNEHSPGGKLTLKACQNHGKPYMVNPTAWDFERFMERHPVSVLNVAGNREHTNPGIAKRVKQFLMETLG